MNTLEIYGTLGPSCCDEKTLFSLFQAGMNGIRLNLSHCNLWHRKDWIDHFHNASQKMDIKPHFLIDIKGPELRLGEVEENITLYKESTLAIAPPLIPEAILKHAQEQDILLIDDGSIHLLVEKNDGLRLWCKTLIGGKFNSNKSIAIQNKSISGDVLTNKDIENLQVAKEYGVTGIMQPFVRSANDLIQVKNTLQTLGLEDLKIYAKIENKEGFEALEEILPYCDMIIIARGDLGNAYGLTKVPIIQHKIEEICKTHNKPYMVVTQMLHSMHTQATPTRAEVSDIFHAVYNGASAIMLTGEIASGNYPVEAMQYFCNTAKEALKYKGGDQL